MKKKKDMLGTEGEDGIEFDIPNKKQKIIRKKNVGTDVNITPDT